MASSYPNHGGCWFCHTDDDKEGGWLYSFEFDTNLHKHCLEEEIKPIIDAPNCRLFGELEIFAREFKYIK